MKKLTELQSYLTRLRGLMLTLIILCSMGIGNAWGTSVTKDWTGSPATSGNVDSNISYSTTRGHATDDPAGVPGGLRIHKPSQGFGTGAYITIAVKDPTTYEITSITLVNSNDYGGTIKYSVDEGDLSSGQSISTEEEFTYNSSTFSTISFYNTGSNRLTFSGVKVTYQEKGTTPTAFIEVTDPNSNVLDDSNPYDFGTVTTTSGSVTISIASSCLKQLDNSGSPYYIEAYLSGDDETNFRINNTDDYHFSSLNSTFTLQYTGLSASTMYATTLVIFGYKATECKDYPQGGDEVITYSITVGVTYDGNPSASASPTSWDFGEVAIGQTVTKDFTISTAHLTSNLAIGMLYGNLGMSVSPSSIAQAATSTTLTVTFTPASAGLKEDMVTIEGSNISDGITVTGTGVAYHAIHWIVNGVDWSLNPGDHGNPTIAVANNTKPTVLPTTPIAGDDGCGDKFMGWTTAEIDGSRGTVPTPCWNSATYFQTVTEETWYYAVFADEQP